MERSQESLGEGETPTAEAKEREEEEHPEEQAEEHPMDVLLSEEEFGLATPKRGEIRTGTIARVTETDILVDVGAKSEGVIPAQELERLPPERREVLVVGTDVTVYVVRSSDRSDTILLSLSRADEERDWKEVEDLLESRDPFEGEVAGYNKGGLIVKLGRLRGFIPASQVSLSRRRRAQGDTPEKRWGKMVGEPIVAKVIEVDRRRNRLILSERAAAREARDILKERLIEELQPGEIRTGHVISLAEFGAFVDIGGADGLIHTSEISWKKVADPREILKVGQKVQVKVLGLDRDRKRISLSLRELEEDPWDTVVGKLVEGQLVEGTITKLTKFGAFASLSEAGEFEIEGLIHVSELSDQRIEHPREIVKKGQSLALRIIRIDKERRRIGLSLKRVDSPRYAELDWKMAMREVESEEDVGEETGVAEELPEPAPAAEEPTEEMVEAGEAAEEEAEAAEPEEAAEAEVGALEPEVEPEEGTKTDEPEMAEAELEGGHEGEVVKEEAPEEPEVQEEARPEPPEGEEAPEQEQDEAEIAPEVTEPDQDDLGETEEPVGGGSSEAAE